MKTDFKKMDKETKKVVKAEDPCKNEGGWLNVPLFEKGYEIIQQFIPILGSLGRVLYNEEMGDDAFAVEIYCNNLYTEVFFSDSYLEVCEYLELVQIAVIEDEAT